MNNAKLLAKMFGKAFDRVPTIILNADINTKKIFISNIDDNLPLSKTAMPRRKSRKHLMNLERALQNRRIFLK